MPLNIDVVEQLLQSP